MKEGFVALSIRVDGKGGSAGYSNAGVFQGSLTIRGWRDAWKVLRRGIVVSYRAHVNKDDPYEHHQT